MLSTSVALTFCLHCFLHCLSRHGSSIQQTATQCNARKGEFIPLSNPDYAPTPPLAAQIVWCRVYREYKPSGQRRSRSGRFSFPPVRAKTVCVCVCEPTDRDRSRRVINWLATKERSEATKQQEARENGWQYHPSSCHFVCSQAPRESTDESLTSFPAIQPPQYREGPGICRMCYWFRAFFYLPASGRAL